MPGVEAEILRSDGAAAQANEAGNLVFKRSWPGQFTGVFQNEDKFKSYFDRFPGNYFSGDGAKRDEDGNYWILGRMDDTINVSGHRLSTVEIESVLAAHPAVGEAAVVPIPHEIKGEAIYAYVALRGEVDWTEELRNELRDWVRKNIGALASPERIQFVENMPKTLSGKIVRRLLRKIASGEALENLGDISTIARPEVLEEIHRAWLRLEAGQSEK